MNRLPVIDRIISALSQLESYLKLNSGQNLNTAPGLAEDFCIPLLKLVYGYDLKNANAESKSAAGIDLLDRDRRLAVQVTVNDTTEKIRETHRTVPGSKFAAEFDRVIIIFLVAKAPAEPKRSGNFTPCVTHTIEPLDLDGIITRIRSLDPAEQEKIAVFLETELGKPKWNPATRISNLPFDTLGDLFIGRNGFLDTLGSALQAGTATVIKAVQAIHGMGGVGKTRAAIEFAWRHAVDFRALLFVTADSPDSLRRNLAALCAPHILDLPEHSATETDAQVSAVLTWLRDHPGWLLILDNVDTPDAQTAVKETTAPFIHGKILITSRLAEWGTGFAALDLDVLTPEDSVKLLLDHTDGQRPPADTDPQDAAEIARLVDGLALALEQAAAYVRRAHCSFATYLADWHQAETRLIEEYRTSGIGDYHQGLPRGLRVTFETSFGQLSDSARHLLRILSWLAPDPMPVGHLGTLAAVPNADEVLSDLEALHLVRHSDSFRAFAVHRIIQEIVRRQQTEEIPPALTEALGWVNGIYQGDPQDVRTWGLLAPLTPHAVSVATFAADHNIPEPSGWLLSGAAVHLVALADHRAAEPLMRRTLAIGEASYGPEHPEVAIRLNNLAAFLQATNRHLEAEQLYRRSLKILNLVRGDNHPNVATSLNNLAQLLQTTNRLAEVEPLMRRALAIDEATFGRDHPNVAVRLNNLALLLQATNRHVEAEPLFRRALEMGEVSLGRDHPKVAIRLNNLASLLRDTNRYSEAEPHYRRALAILEASFGEHHPNVASGLNNLAQLLQATNRLAEAEPLYRRALSIDEATFGQDHPSVAGDLGNLAGLLQATNRLNAAEPLMRRALVIDEASFGQSHPNVAIRVNNLASLLYSTNRIAEAEPLMRRALEIDEGCYGSNHPNVARDLNNLATLLQATNRLAEAEPLMRRAHIIWEASLGENHPNVAASLNNLAAVLKATNRIAEAATMMWRALAMDERSFGEQHPSVAIRLNNLASLLMAANRSAEAEPLLRRALAIDEASFGEDHPDVARDLNNLGQLLKTTNRLEEAEPLMWRALAIWESSFGEHHPNVAASLNNLAALLQATNRLVEAEALMRRMVEIFLKFTQATGHPHPHLQAAVGNYAGLLRSMGRSPEDISRELSSLASQYGLAISGTAGREANEPSSALRPVLEEIMRDQEKLPEIFARLKQEEPDLLKELIAFIQSRQDSGPSETV